MDEDTSARMNAEGTGLAWVTRNVKKGIVMLAHEEHVYNRNLFYEVRETKKVAVWPVGLQSHIGVRTPVVDNEELIGYINGYMFYSMELFFNTGGSAFNLNYLNDKKLVRKIWRLCMEEDYTNEDIGIPLEDISVIANKSTQIFVWRLSIRKQFWSKSIPFKKRYNGTNMEELYNNVTELNYPKYH